MDGRDSLVTYVEVLESHARARGVPVASVKRAAAATVRALGGESDGPLLRTRARRYFWTVVRKAPSGAGPNVRARFMLSTVVEDLIAAGRTPRGVWDELERGWSDKVPRDVLEEYRSRLLA